MHRRDNAALVSGKTDQLYKTATHGVKPRALKRGEDNITAGPLELTLHKIIIALGLNQRARWERVVKWRLFLLVPEHFPPPTHVPSYVSAIACLSGHIFVLVLSPVPIEI